ncbi:phosphate ABC transporter substrate-binding protein PstS, partial [Xanthomonas sp. Kuri4-2]
MKLQPVGLAALSLAIALAMTACKPGNDGQAAADATPGSAATAPAAGERTSAEISGAGASFIYPLVSKWSADYNAATG